MNPGEKIIVSRRKKGLYYILSPEYAAHFHDIYIDGKEGAKMTGDSMKMLMLTLPFMVRDLIEPEVHVHVFTFYIPVVNMYTTGFAHQQCY